jgi:hypothetical protein
MDGVSIDAGSLATVPPATEPPAGPLAERPLAERPPGVRQIIGRSLDLALASSSEIRRASLYVGLLTLALAGPAVVLFLVFARQQGGLEEAVESFSSRFGVPIRSGVLAPLGVSALFASLGLFGVIVEAQIIVTAILGGAATGRRMAVREALRLSRLVFWRVLGAAILVGILSLIVSVATTALLHPTSVTASERSEIWQLAAQAIATTPFAFFLTGIVIGGVGPIESLRRSVRIARARWRLAILVASAGAVIAFVQAFALGAGLDLLVRVGTAAGLGLSGSVPAFVLTGFLVLAAVMAIGSLVVTVNALIVAPQVVVFIGMTGYSAGLDRASPAMDPPRYNPRLRLVTWPMIILIVLAWLAALAGLMTV